MSGVSQFISLPHNLVLFLGPMQHSVKSHCVLVVLKPNGGANFVTSVGQETHLRRVCVAIG